MKSNGHAKAKLQISIKEWMRENIPEAHPLFRLPENDDDHYGVSVTPGRACTASQVALHAADAAYRSVIAAIEVLGLDVADDGPKQGQIENAELSGPRPLAAEVSRSNAGLEPGSTN